MGTACRITVYVDGPDGGSGGATGRAREERAAAAAGAAFARIAELEAVLSDYRPDSEAMRVFRGEPGVWHVVSADLAAVLRESGRIHAATDGAFDPMLGPLTQLWREARKTGQLAAPEVLEEAMGRSGMRLVEVDPVADRVRFAVAGMRPDFGGIGKGWGADEALAVLRKRGLPRALVDFGGDLVAGEAPPGSERGWRVVVRDGVGAEREVWLRDGAVATSGDLEQLVEIGGVRYSHIIDPRTGLGVTARRAATVVVTRGERRGAVADAVASAACVVGGVGTGRLEEAFASVRVEVVERR